MMDREELEKESTDYIQSHEGLRLYIDRLRVLKESGLVTPNDWTATVHIIARGLFVGTYDSPSERVATAVSSILLDHFIQLADEFTDMIKETPRGGTDT